MRRPSRGASVAADEGDRGCDLTYSERSAPHAHFSGAHATDHGLPVLERIDWLSRTIESEVIPRLMLAHIEAPARADAKPRSDTGQSAVETGDAERLAALAIGADPDAALEFIRRARADGVSIESAFLELLAPAARHLGALWEADICPFTEVTVGLWRLQRVMHELGWSFQCDDTGMAPRHALLVPVPGSQHTMGWFMLSQFFLRAGWQVSGDAMYSGDDVVEAVRMDSYDMIGFSLGSETHEVGLRSVILRVRKASRNRRIVVMIGGPIVVSNPTLVHEVGADATAVDARRAVTLAESLVAERSTPP